MAISRHEEPAITIDFHNTLVECDAWFDLEVRTLVGQVVCWSQAQGYDENMGVDLTEIDRAYHRLRQAIHHHGHELDAHRSTTAVLERMGLSLPQDVIEEATRSLMYGTFSSARPVPGALDLLHSFKDHGFQVSVVSSAVYQPFLEWALASFGMDSYLDGVVTSASAGFYKSRPEIYWTALDRLGARADRAVHIGDSLRFDVGGAKVAGMRTVWFDRGRSHDRMSENGLPTPDLIVADLHDVSGDIVQLARRLEVQVLS